jgi:hypothetical protein
MVRIARSAIAVGLLASLVAGLRMPEQVLMGEDFSQVSCVDIQVKVSRLILV